MAKENEPKTAKANRPTPDELEEKVVSAPVVKPELPVTGTFIHTPGPQGYLIGVAAGEKVILELENAKNLLEQGIVKKEK